MLRKEAVGEEALAKKGPIPTVVKAGLFRKGWYFPPLCAHSNILCSLERKITEIMNYTIRAVRSP